MNERIQLLALQAGMGETKLGVGKIYQFYGDGLERFAELIVQECVSLCEVETTVVRAARTTETSY